MTKKKKQQKKNHDEIRQEVFRKGTPLASIIWERDQYKEAIPKEMTSLEWNSRLTVQSGAVANEIENPNNEELEDELIKLAALSALWIEQIRALRKKKKKSS